MKQIQSCLALGVRDVWVKLKYRLSEIYSMFGG